VTEVKRNAHRIFDAKFLRKVPLERLRWRWENNKNMDVEATAFEDSVIRNVKSSCYLCG
jgi:hypothetical protein